MQGWFFAMLFVGTATITARTAAQSDSVDVTFQYRSTGSPAVVHLPGEFNNWANNSSGSITPNPKWTMTRQPDGTWMKTIRLRIGGGSAPGGGYEYKINENGSPDGWLADPLNPRTNGSYGNSVIHVRKPTVFPVLPRTGGVVSSDTVLLVARIFPVVGGAIDTARSQVLRDGATIGPFDAAYDSVTSTLRIAITGLGDGEHLFTVVAVDDRGSTAQDSTRLTIKAAPLQWLTRSNPHVDDSSVTVSGLITTAGITGIQITVAGGTAIPAAVTDTTFSATITLHEGDNIVQAAGMRNGVEVRTNDLILHRVVDHTPHPVIQFGSTPNRIDLNAFASTDPDGDVLTYTWMSEDSLNPMPLGIRQSGPVLSFASPIPGEWFMRLEARDPAGNTGVMRSFFTVHEDATSEISTIDGNAQWVRDAIIYEIFPPAFSMSETLQGIIDRIPQISALGVNTLWLTPVMDNPGSINDMNGGYNIIDFYRVDESLGTNADFLRLVDAAHAAALRIIVDMTPNHVSGDHPWVRDIEVWRDQSIYRGFIENRILGTDRGLGQSIVSIGGYPLYARYSNWGLANINYQTRGAREAMLDVFRFWLRDMRTDGFRLDVYWGPQSRYGAPLWWRPFREEMKRLKPEALILAETDATGPGSEVNFADAGGAADAAYDWNWYGQIKNTMNGGDVGNLHARTSNYSPDPDYNHFTGPHAAYMRFLENHDEDRIAQLFSSNVARTKSAAAVLFTTPGMPMIYAGQEVGWKGRRTKIDFGNADRPLLLPWYTKLTHLRSHLAALRSPRIRLLQNTTSAVYSYLRPQRNANVVCAASFRATAATVTLNIGLSDLELSEPLDTGRTWYMNDMLCDSTWAVRVRDLSSFTFTLQPWQSRAFLLSDTARFPLVTAVQMPPAPAADAPALGAVWPHPIPLGDGATIGFTLPDGDSHSVELTLHDLLGRRITTLLRGSLRGGGHHVPIRTADLPASGAYICRLATRSERTGAITVRTKTLTVLP